MKIKCKGQRQKDMKLMKVERCIQYMHPHTKFGNPK